MLLIRAFVDLFGYLTMASFVTQWSWSSRRLTVQLDVISNDYVRTYEWTRVIYLIQKLHPQPFIHDYPSLVAHSHFEFHSGSGADLGVVRVVRSNPLN